MILRGLWLLARGKSAGIKEFGNSNDALTASLAPLIAFPLVGAAVTAFDGQPEQAVVAFLARLCAVLVVPVMTREFARRMGGEAFWLRTATALNWSFWMILPVLLAAAFAGALLAEAGVPDIDAEYIALALILLYLAWFQWFIIRAGLQVGVIAAAMLVVLNGIAIGLLSAGPGLIGMAASVLVAK